MTNYAGVGSIVKFLFIEDDEISETKLVNYYTNNSNYLKGETKVDSILGKELLGSQVGDIITIESEEPYSIKVLKIQNPTNENLKLIDKINNLNTLPCLIAGKSYGTNSRTIYTDLCKSLNWDIAKAGYFGQQGKPLHAINADTDKTRDVWFIHYYSNNLNINPENFKFGVNTDLSIHAINIVEYNGEKIYELIDESYWKPNNGHDRIVFIKNKDTFQYEFLGVFKVVKMGKFRVYERISKIYPIDFNI